MFFQTYVKIFVLNVWPGQMSFCLHSFSCSMMPFWSLTHRSTLWTILIQSVISQINVLLTVVCSLTMQNGNPQNPYCNGIEGVMEAYYQSLKSVQLYGPTNFSPVINHVARCVCIPTYTQTIYILLDFTIYFLLKCIWITASILIIQP